MEELEKKIGYTFTDKELLLTALTHSSFYNENRDLRPCNERLEFLGDAVLSAVCAEFLYRHERGDEGNLSRTRAMLVREEALYEYASEIELGKYLFLGKGEASAEPGPPRWPTPLRPLSPRYIWTAASSGPGRLSCRL